MSDSSRTEKCGSAVVLPTYPAYSFGHKYPSDKVTVGPGSGKYCDGKEALKFLWNPGTARFGGRHVKDPEPQYRSPPLTNSYLKPGYLTSETPGPSYSFGVPHAQPKNAVPGSGSYSPSTNDLFQVPRRFCATLGPPPKPRLPAAPPPLPTTFIDRRKPKSRTDLPGATIKFPWRHSSEGLSPGPAAYHPCTCDLLTAGCCNMCCKYHGSSFGIRHRPFKPDPVPGPKYHTDCSTLGAAATVCQTYRDPSSLNATQEREEKVAAARAAATVAGSGPAAKMHSARRAVDRAEMTILLNSAERGGGGGRRRGGDRRGEEVTTSMGRRNGAIGGETGEGVNPKFVRSSSARNGSKISDVVLRTSAALPRQFLDGTVEVASAVPGLKRRVSMA